MKINFKDLYFLKNQMHVWILSYIVVIVISILFNSISYSFAISNMKKEAEKFNLSMLEHIKKVYDVAFSNIENVAYKSLYSNTVENIVNTSKIDNSMKWEWFKTVLRDVQLSETNDIINKSYIVFQKSDICFDDAGIYKLDMAYDLFFKNYFDLKDAWIDTVFSGDVEEYKLIIGNDGSKKLYYIRRYVSYLMTHPVAIVVDINIDKVNSYLESTAQYDDEKFYIADEENKVVFGPDDKNFIEFKISNSIQTFDGQKNVVNFVNSTNKKWKYIHTIPNDRYTSTSENMRRIFIYSYLLCILVGVYLAYIFSKRHYKPIGTILGKLNKEGVKETTESEYGYIQRTIDKVLEERSIDKKIVEKQSENILQNEMAKLLKNHAGVDAEKLKLKENLMYENYAVITFDVIDNGFLSSNENNYDDIVNVHFVISNVLSEVLSENAKTVFCAVDNLFACIVNYDDLKCTKELIVDKLNFTRQFLNEYLKIKLICSLSGHSTNFNELYKLYGQAFDAISLSYSRSNGSILDYENLTKDEDSYEYSMDTERILLTLLKFGDEKKSVELVGGIFDKNLNNKNLSIRTLGILISEIISTLLKSRIEIDKSNEIETRSLCNLTTKLVRFNEINDVFGEIEEFVRKLCDISKINNSRQKDGRITKIIEYIENNYKNQDLNVNMIADIFGLTANYLSAYFKESTGEGLSDYIVKFRIQTSKQLLASSLNINEIASNIGFNDVNVYIRSFKKFEGTTPGKYRTSLYNEN